MKALLAAISTVVLSSSAFAFQGLCIYSDNYATQTKPNGSILTIPVTLRDKDVQTIVSLPESSGLIKGILYVTDVKGAEQVSMVVGDESASVLFNKSTDSNSGLNYLGNIQVAGRRVQVSLVCVPRR